MRTVGQLFAVIPYASFVKIDKQMYRLDGHILEEEEKKVYVLDENSGEVYVYDLMDLKATDVNDLQSAEFYSLILIEP